MPPFVFIITLVVIKQADDGQQGRDPVAAVEHVHRVFVFLAADEEDRDDRRQQAEGADDEREEDPGLRVRPAGRRRDGVDADAQDHRADVLGGGRLEQVRTTAGAVADVVADEVGDDARVARVVFGDALLDLADEVRADVGGLGVDAAAELGEQRDERGPEAEADDEERRLGDGDLADEGRVEGEDAPHAEERQGDDQEARTAPPRIATWTASTRLRRAADAVRTLALTAMSMPMMPEAIEHAAPTMKANPVMTPIGRPASFGHVGDLGGFDEADDDADHHGADDGEDPDGRVLATDEGDRTLVDGAGHVLHRLRPGVAREDVPGQVDGEQDGDDPGRQDDQLK